ncbi:hypothetical protein HanHA89_Chr13g0501471 [Helianthus annuus]|nr:hypothetical protein HanHA89_Chr13g0501471 [Helianthus annuus]
MKTRALSIGGRVILLKSVLNSLPLYFFSLFKGPKGILNELEAFGGGGDNVKAKTSWVCWERVTGPIDKGGGSHSIT